MGCGCRGGVGGKLMADVPKRMTRPEEACVFCAEKHFSAAWALARENGYYGANLQRLVGELILAQWHLWEKHRALAEKLREIRHGLQHGPRPREEDWERLALEVGAVADAEEPSRNNGNP